MTIDLEVIEARCKVCQPGPWESKAYRDKGTPYETWGVQEISKEGICGGWIVHDAGQPETDFIAHARTDVPVLIAEIKRLQDKLELHEELYVFSENDMGMMKAQRDGARDVCASYRNEIERLCILVEATK